ncbi:MAG: hypothetical protein IJ733_04485 [Lachnospiraceae bacterium]|nr:hypothetical protein [Lachnospiraceae bacterium]
MREGSDWCAFSVNISGIGYTLSEDAVIHLTLISPDGNVLKSVKYEDGKNSLFGDLEFEDETYHASAGQAFYFSVTVKDNCPVRVGFTDQA